MKTCYQLILIIGIICHLIIPKTLYSQENVQIPSTAVAPVIDGVIDVAWGADQSKYLEHVLAGSATSASDFSAYYKTVWDASGLYVLTVVTDEAQKNDSQGEVWKDDAIEVYIDIDNNKLSSYGTTDYQYTFRWNDQTIHSNNGIVEGIQFKISSNSSGYVLEAKFPWSTLGLTTPRTGVLLGFDLHVHDDDDGGDRDNKLAWFTTIDQSYLNPSLFATAKLVGDIVILYPAEKPKISVQQGFYKKPFDVVISTAVDEMTIYYTLDGSDPATSPYAVSAPSPAKVRIDPQNFQDRGKTPGVVLRARAKSNNYEYSPIVTHSYLFVDKMNNQTSFPGHDWPAYNVNGQWIDLLMDNKVLTDSRYSSLIDDALLEVPTVAISTDNFNLFDPDSGIYVNAWGHGLDWERPASVELINPDGSDGFQIDAGLRIRGGYSRNTQFRKHAFRLFFRDEYGEGKLKFPLFENEGVKSFDKVDLRCAQNYSWSKADGYESPLYTFTRDVFSRDIQGKMEQEYTRSRYCHLFLNGLYWGLYQTQERAEARFAASYMGGEPDDYDVVKKADEGGIEATDGTLDTWREVWDICQQGFSSTANYYKIQGLNASGVRDPNLKVLVDIDNLIDYMNIIFYTGNYDAPVSAFGSNKSPNNFYAIYNRNDDRGFTFVAHDNEHTLIVDPINSSRGITENRVNIGSISGGNKMVVNQFENFHPQWLHFKLSENAEYRQRFSDRSYKQYYNNGVFTPEFAVELFRKRTLEIDTAVIAESARWGDDQYGNVMTKDDNWIPAVQRIIDGFFPYRTDIVIEQLKKEKLLSSIPAPVFKFDNLELIAENIRLAPGDALGLVNVGTEGNVIYTIDGNDPRLVGDGISSTAINGGKTTTISILQTCVIKARVFNNGEWSPLHTLTVTVDSQLDGLQLTEIHYNPLGQNGLSGSEYEFVELKNNGTTPVNLTSCLFIDGIKFSFSNETIIDPGKFVVLASSAYSFRLRYGFSPNGEFDGQLDNKGERITLVNAIGDTIISVKYNDKEPWPTTPDSLGFSLVPAVNGVAADWNDGQNWRASSVIGGSPNADDGNVIIPEVFINEILSNSEKPLVDAIELFNPNGFEVNIGGWYLSDNRDMPKKWMIPAGTVIPANGFLLFNEGHYVNSTLAYTSSEFGSAFSLSSFGEEVYLFSGSSGELTGYEYGFDFGAVEQGVSIGSYVNSLGKKHFVAQENVTLNAVNGSPRVGPVVINQIMYHPTPEQFEYLELVNVSPNDVNLYEESNRAAWKVEGIDFTFPENITLLSGQSVYLVEQEVSPSDFRAFFNLDTTVLVFNFNGSLKNEGEEITLFKAYKSYTENNEEKVSYIRIDKVDYNDNDLWADADGNGYALQRTDSTAYGNDPVSWIATPPGMKIRNSYLADAIEGIYYSRELKTLGGNAPFSWSSSGGSLPEGLTLNPVTGIIDGIPVQVGEFNIIIRVEDTGGASKTVELLLKVIPNSLPVAVSDTITVLKNHFGNISVLTNDIDNDGDKSVWSVSIVSQPTHGSAVVNNDKTITYKPESNFLGSDEITYRVTDSKGSADAKVLISEVVEDWVLQYTYQFANLSSDDAEENISTKAIDLTSRSLEMGYDELTKTSQLVGIRFPNIPSLPEGSVIVQSFLIFNSGAINTSPASLTIWGEASINPVTYSASNLISTRKLTTASVAWNPEPWGEIDYQAYFRTTSDITPIMNELIGMGWKSNKPVAFVIKGSGTRTAQSTNSGSYMGPVLYVIYANPNAEVSTPVAAINGVTNIGKGEMVQLDGTTSSSSDNRQLNYYWTLVSKPEGSNAQLSNPSSSVPSFIADQFGEYVVSLKVDNGTKSSETVTLTIPVSNQQPIAHAGSDQTRCRGSLIRLNGSGSTDANGDMLSYVWEWVQKPEGSNALLSSPHEVNPTFSADLEGNYTLGLTVSDKYTSSIADFVQITVTTNQTPLANAGNDKEVVTGSLLSLDGTKSNDPEEDQLFYHWTIVSKPLGSATMLSDTAYSKPVIQPDIAGEYLISLTVSDGINTSTTDEVKITAVNNLPPLALAGADQSTTEHLIVSLDGSDSYDPEGEAVYYQWSFISKPFGSSASIIGANTSKPTFQPDTEGLYAIKLRISDGVFTSEDQLQVTALNNVTAQYLMATNSFNVYPNPFTDRLVVEYNIPSGQKVEFALYNLSGVKICRYEFESNGKCTQVLNLENERLGNGMYLLVMKPEKGEPRAIKVTH
jgi:hypothetical protein